MNQIDLEKELKKLEKCIVFCKKRLENLPAGKLIVARNGSHYKWYVSMNGHSDGIRFLSKKPLSNQQLAKELALKNYLSIMLSHCAEQKELALSYLQSLERSEKDMMKILSNPEYRKLLSSFYCVKNEDLASWAAASYESSGLHPENLKYPSPSGHVLRSKSEVIIDMTLSSQQIPFRYEASLSLDGITFYPDFTIRHPVSGSYYYWEHFGMIDNPDYFSSFTHKLRYYIDNGILPGMNLIMTFETSSHPLSPLLVDQLVQYYLL